MDYRLTSRQYASIYGCTARTIERCRREVAPLDDPRAMFALWAGKKQAPAGAVARGLKRVLADYALVAGGEAPAGEVPAKPVAALKEFSLPPVEYDRGAQHALRRLEDMEVEARLALTLVDEADDPLTYKARLDRYLKISESLRKFDLLVEQDRRDSGELIPRAEAELAAEMAATWLCLAVQTFVGSYTERLARERDLPTIANLIRQGMAAAVETNLLRAPLCRAALPAWAAAAVRRGYDVDPPAGQ